MRESVRLYDQQVQSVDQLTGGLMQIIRVILQNSRQNLKISGRELLAQSPKRLFERTEQNNDYLDQRLLNAIKTLLKNKRIAFQQRVQTLEDINPLKVLSRRYIYMIDQVGKMVMSTKNITKDEVLNLHLTDGKAKTRILGIEDNEDTK